MPADLLSISVMLLVYQVFQYCILVVELAESARDYGFLQRLLKTRNGLIAAVWKRTHILTLDKAQKNHRALVWLALSACSAYLIC